MTSVRANIQCGCCGVPTIWRSTSMTVERREKEVTTIGTWQLAHNFTRCDETSKTFLVCKGIARAYWASCSSCRWCAQNILRLSRPDKHKEKCKLLCDVIFWKIIFLWHIPKTLVHISEWCHRNCWHSPSTTQYPEHERSWRFSL